MATKRQKGPRLEVTSLAELVPNSLAYVPDPMMRKLLPDVQAFSPTRGPVTLCAALPAGGPARQRLREAPSRSRWTCKATQKSRSSTTW